MVKNRSGAAGKKGYSYQTHYSVKLILNYYHNNKNADNKLKYIKEEGLEDIDLYYEDETRDLYRLRYGSSLVNSEPLTKNSGFYTVIISNYNIKNINKIILAVYLNNMGPFSKLKNMFSIKENYDYIKKLIMLIYYINYYNTMIKNNRRKKQIKESISIDTTNKDIDKIFKKYHKQIHDLSKNEPHEILDFFLNDKEGSDAYLSKFCFDTASKYDELENDIYKAIELYFPEHVKTKNDSYNDLAKFIIRYKIYNKMEKIIFSESGENTKILLNDIYNIILQILNNLDTYIREKRILEKAINNIITQDTISENYVDKITLLIHHTVEFYMNNEREMYDLIKDIIIIARIIKNKQQSNQKIFNILAILLFKFELESDEPEKIVKYLNSLLDEPEWVSVSKLKNKTKNLIKQITDRRNV
jgi:hypothetical protein